MAEDIPLSSGAEEDAMVTYRVAQDLNLFGRRGAAKDVARAVVRGEQARLRRTSWDARAKAVSLFYELWMNGEMRTIIKRQLELLGAMREAALARYSAGLDMAHHDVLRAEAEVAQMKAEQATLEEERLAIIAMLNVLRGRPGEEEAGEPVLPSRGELPTLLSVLGSTAGRPEIEAARAMRQEADARVSLAQKMYLPMVMVGASYQQRTGGMPDAFGFEATVSIPVWWWDRQSNEVAMNRAMVTRAEREVEAMTLMTEAELRMAWSRARGAERNVQVLQDDAIPKMKETVESSRAAYTSGTASFLTLLEATLALRELEARRLEAVVRFETARWELGRLVGAPVEGMK
jgi:outer membrane protein TolC